MACRNAVELEHTINARLYHIVRQKVTGDNVERRLQAIAEVSLSSMMWELIGNGSIPATLIKGKSGHEWAEDMLRLVETVIKPNEDPPIQVNVRRMAEKIFEGQIVAPSGPARQRAAISAILSSPYGLRNQLRDEELANNLERQGLEQVLMPQGSVQREGRARIAVEVQKTVAEVQAKRERELAEERQKEKEKKEVEDNGFGRKVELD